MDESRSHWKVSLFDLLLFCSWTWSQITNLSASECIFVISTCWEYSKSQVAGLGAYDQSHSHPPSVASLKGDHTDAQRKRQTHAHAPTLRHTKKCICITAPGSVGAWGSSLFLFLLAHVGLHELDFLSFFSSTSMHFNLAARSWWKAPSQKCRCSMKIFEKSSRGDKTLL